MLTPKITSGSRAPQEHQAERIQTPTIHPKTPQILSAEQKEYLKAGLSNKDKDTKPNWFNTLHDIMKEHNIALTSKNIKDCLPSKEAQYDDAYELADALEHAENMRQTIAQGENPNPTLGKDGFAFIEHDENTQAAIEKFANAAYKATLSNEACKKHIENGGYIWLDVEQLTFKNNTFKLHLEGIGKSAPMHYLELEGENIYDLEGHVQQFKDNITQSLYKQTFDELSFGYKGSTLKLQIGGNKVAQEFHKDDPTGIQKREFNAEHKNIQCYTTTYAPKIKGKQQKQTEFVPTGLKAFVLHAMTLYAENTDNWGYTDKRDMPDEFVIRPGRSSHASVFAAQTLGKKRPQLGTHERRHSTLHIPPHDINKEDDVRIFLFGRLYCFHEEKGTTSYRDKFKDLFKKETNLPELFRKVSEDIEAPLEKIETLYKALKPAKTYQKASIKKCLNFYLKAFLKNKTIKPAKMINRESKSEVEQYQIQYSKDLNELKDIIPLKIIKEAAQNLREGLTSIDDEFLLKKAMETAYDL